MITTTRRTLLRTGALTLVAAPFALPRAAFAAATSTDRLYRRSRFAGLRRKSFKVTGGEAGAWRLRLTSVSDLDRARRGDQESFSLTFRSPVSGPPQGSYTLGRAGFASTTLFLVPSDSSRRTYQAVVNRSASAG